MKRFHSVVSDAEFDGEKVDDVKLVSGRKSIEFNVKIGHVVYGDFKGKTLKCVLMTVGDFEFPMKFPVENESKKGNFSCCMMKMREYSWILLCY